MTTLKDRKDIEKLVVPPSNNRNATTPWKHEPTQIQVPKNLNGPGTHSRYTSNLTSNPSGRQTRHTSNPNPFNQNPNEISFKKNPQVGNQTAGRTVVAPGRQEGPPTKKRKTEIYVKPSEPSALNSAKSIDTNGHIHHTRPSLQKPEVINVDEDLVDHQPTWQSRQSSDELNSIPRPSTSGGQVSKYPFGHLGKAKSNPSIVADGPETKWVDGTYGGLDSDPIEEYSERRTSVAQGQVSREVERIERLESPETGILKVDFVAMQKGKAASMKRRGEKLLVTQGDARWKPEDISGQRTTPKVLKPSGRMKELKRVEKQKNHNLLPAPRTGKRKASPDMTPKPPSTDVFKMQHEKQLSTTSRPSTDRDAGSSNFRRSTRNIIAPKATQSADQDEVILVYPQGTPGAVNITNAELRRLEPGEFLNDTLIEFGLKLWLRELEQTNPELASQIHIFNSFFYKKLNHKKDPQQAFESVKKWTAKLDIFQKKYIIVPINEHLHWYLAIIYEPEHVLLPTTVETSTRKQTRSSMKTSGSHSQSPGAISKLFSDKDDRNVTSSEAEVELNLKHDFQNSCTIENTDDYVLQQHIVEDDDRSSAALSYVSEAPVVSCLRHESPTNSLPHERNSESPNRMAVDIIEEVDMPNMEKAASAVEPASFYQKLQKRKGKQKAVEPDHHIMDIEQDEDRSVIILNESPKTYIFTMDSLGTKHPAVIKKLANYLSQEARDKKGVSNASLAEGKHASVPVQPNFCDCGVYLLHFAQTFISDPKKFCKTILSQKTKSIANKERQDTWQDYKVANMREALATRIHQLAMDWKESRVSAPKEEVLQPDSGNDSGPEVVILELSQRSPAKKGNGRSSGAKRVRG